MELYRVNIERGERRRPRRRETRKKREARARRREMSPHLRFIPVFATTEGGTERVRRDAKKAASLAPRVREW